MTTLRSVAIVAPIRTVVGKFGGALASLTAGELGGIVLKALMERNEAFAPQVLACLKTSGWSDEDDRHEILNVNGSGISLGHPIGATGKRILANLTREMRRRDVRYGLDTMCIGGGQGIAAVCERA